MLSGAKLFFKAVYADLVDTYERLKIVIFAVLALIGYLEFDKIKDAVIVYSGKKEIQNDQKKSDALGIQETQENQQADALVKQAQDLPKQEQPVTDSWYKDTK